MSSSTTTQTGTTFKMTFDFTSDNQRGILQTLQAGGYKLCGFKGASGPNQITSGLPCWFSEPFQFMFGQVEIDYTPLFKVFVFNQASIGAYTTIKMDVLSDAVPLGSALAFNQDGSFGTSDIPAPADSILLFNNTSAGTPNVTVGLAALVNGSYQPFCAFVSTPQGMISMTPHETICVFAAQTDLRSGSVTAKAAAPGAEFEFSATNTIYALAIANSTFQVIGAPGGAYVNSVSAGTDLSLLLNS